MNWKEITSIEKAFEAKGIDLATLPEKFAWMPEHMREFQIISFKLNVVIEAINEMWVADWSNTKQQKWYNWWAFASGFGFSGTGCNCVCTSANVGSRLVFENKQKAEHGAIFFIELYKQYYYVYGKMKGCLPDACDGKEVVIEGKTYKLTLVK